MISPAGPGALDHIGAKIVEIGGDAPHVEKPSHARRVGLLFRWQQIVRAFATST